VSATLSLRYRFAVGRANLAYYEESREAVCAKCGEQNHVIIAYSGDARANERETVSCFECNAALADEKCFAIYSGATADEALQQLRRMQNRT
jgi:hypothetical protein